MKYSIFMVAACLPSFIVASSNEATIPLSLQEALVEANKTYKQRILSDGLISHELKKSFEKISSKVDLIAFLSAATLITHECGKESNRQLYRVQLYMNNNNTSHEMPVCTVPMVTRNGLPMTKEHLEFIINKMVELKLLLSSDEKTSPTGAHWKASPEVLKHLGNITFDKAGNPLYCNKTIKMPSGYSFLTSKIVQLIDIKESNLRFQHEDIEDGIEALSSRMKLKPPFILRERYDHYEAIEESISATIVLQSGQSSAPSCSIL